MLELGAGSGLFTKQIIETDYFKEIYVTDGAPNMLEIAKENLHHNNVTIHYNILNFVEKNWSDQFKEANISSVTSSKALHHAENKLQLFKEIYNVLTDDGVFVFANHIAGSTKKIDQLIGTKRARIRIGEYLNMEDLQVTQFIKEDNRKQAAEGNVCESVSSYLTYLENAGFVDVDCIWRDYWLAVFVARK